MGIAGITAVVAKHEKLVIPELPRARVCPLVNHVGFLKGHAVHQHLATTNPQLLTRQANDALDVVVRCAVGRVKDHNIPPLRLLGYDVGEESLVVGDTLYLRLFWEATEAMDEAYRLQLGLRGEDGELYGERVFDLVNTDYATTEWQKGQLLQERYSLPVSERLPTGEATVELSLVNEDGQSVNSDPVSVTRVWIQSTRPSFEVPADIATPSGVTFGEKMRLLGYDVENSARAGGDVEVTLHWQAQDEMEKAYKVFVHLYDETGALVAQRDRLPGLGVRPTQVWEKGEVVADRYRIPIDRGIPAGTYQIGIGFYDAETGERLVAFGPDGESLDQDRILLGSVEVKR